MITCVQVLTDTTVIMGSGDQDIKDSCPRCGGKVSQCHAVPSCFPLNFEHSIYKYKITKILPNFYEL